MDLNTVWFGLITILFCGFFVLEGFDYGVGILLPFAGRTDRERRMILNSIGTFWDGNEVWMITAGGALFAAFPHWYATLFSGFYVALLLILVGLILRGVAFEFRSKDERPVWRAFWDGMLFIGSLLPAFVWGVAVGNFLLGVPINAAKTFTGSFASLLNPFSLWTGLVFILLFALHGALFLCLKTSGPVLERVRSWTPRLWFPALAVAAVFLVWGALETGLFGRSPATRILAAAPAVTLLLAGGALRRAPGRAFALTSLTILLTTAAVFVSLYPRVMISTLDPAWSLTIYNASSSPYTLKVMTVIAVVFVPVVLVYQGWTYWVFRKRLTDETPLEY